MDLAARKAAIASADEMAANGVSIGCSRCTFAPAGGRSMGPFEAASPEAVKRLDDKAGIPCVRVVDALDPTPCPRGTPPGWSRQRPWRMSWMSRSRIFLRRVLRLTPRSSAALIWLPRVAASAAEMSGYSTSRKTRW